MADDNPNDSFQFTFPQRVYVGVKANHTFNIEDPPLGFMVADGDDAAAKKRKKTVDDWCVSYVQSKDRGGHPPRVITNEPMEGFEFDKMIERYETSNKVFRITDPRGFQLEIPAENLADILRNAQIDRGLLIGEFVWGRRNAYNWLIRVDHPAYKMSVTEKITRPIQPGDHVRQGKEDLIYVGPVFTYNVSLIEEKDHKGHHYFDGRYMNYKTYYDFSTRRVTATHHLFISCGSQGVPRTQWNSSELMYVTKSDISKLIIVAERDVPQFPADKTVISGQGYRDWKLLFQTKEAAKAFDMTDNEVWDFVCKHDKYIHGERRNRITKK